jgi:hypothetical protein
MSEQLDQPIARHEGFNGPGISLFARRFITIVFVTNLLAIAVLLAAILPLGNKAIPLRPELAVALVPAMGLRPRLGRSSIHARQPVLDLRHRPALPP